MQTRDRSPVPKPSRQGAVVLAGLVACALLSAVVRKPATIERDVVDWACNFVYTSCEDDPQGATSNTQVFYEALRQTATNFSGLVSEDPALIQTITAIVEKIKATSLAGSELSASTSAANATAAVAATEQRSLPDGMGPERRAGQLSEMNNTIAAAFEGQQHTRSAAAPASGGGAMMVTAVVIAVLVILALVYRRTRARQLKAEKAPVIEAPPPPPLAPRPQPQAGSGAGSHSLPIGAVGAAAPGQPHACASCGVSSSARRSASQLPRLRPITRWTTTLPTGWCVRRRGATSGGRATSRRKISPRSCLRIRQPGCLRQWTTRRVDSHRGLPP